MICNTAVKDGLLERNPCQIVGAMNPKPKKKVKIPTTVELHTIADKLGADERTSPFKALVLPQRRADSLNALAEAASVESVFDRG